MLPRIAQSLVVLCVAGLAWLIVCRWTDPASAGLAVGILALLVIARVLIRPLSFESWESFWDDVARSVWWW